MALNEDGGEFGWLVTPDLRYGEIWARERVRYSL